MKKELLQKHQDIKRVVLMGPESTGKSTLAKALAKAFDAHYVPEYMRTYLEKKWQQEAKLCEEDDLQPIVEGQLKSENEQAAKTNKLLICDTNALQNLIYAKAYYPNFQNNVIDFCVAKHSYDLYLLCGIDVPWEDDLLRDKPHEREKMFRIFATALNQRKLNYHLIEGNIEERLELTIPLIQKLIK